MAMETVRYPTSEGKKFIATEATVELTIVKCICGMHFGVPSALYRAARKWNGPQGWNITCPLGHSFHYTGESTDERLERQLEEAKRQTQATRDLLAHEERSHAATRGHLTRQRRRAAAGVCPCCNRTFQQLARHMKTKHPDFDPANGAAAS